VEAGADKAPGRRVEDLLAASGEVGL